MTVYAQIGSSLQQVDGSCPVGWVQMREQRPDGDYWLAAESGAWALDVDLLLARIDTTADSVRSTVAGDPLRAVEYDRAVLEAQQFKEAGYPADAVPRSVAAGVVSGQTPQASADAILRESALYTEALYSIREIRLQAKADVRALAEVGDVAAVLGRTEAAMRELALAAKDSGYAI